jgi:hypothetical protein
MTTTHTEDIAHTQDTVVMWECCNDGYGGPFNPTGNVAETKADALEELKYLRETNPNTYLVKVVMTKCPAEEEQAEDSLN